MTTRQFALRVGLVLLAVAVLYVAYNWSRPCGETGLLGTRYAHSFPWGTCG